MKKTWIALGLCLSVVAAGCSSEKAEIKEDRLTVGKVQGEIKVGMRGVPGRGDSSAARTSSRQMSKRREVWIYDKVSTDRVEVANSSFAGIILIMGTKSSEKFQLHTAAHPHHHHQVRRREKGPRLCLQLYAVLARAAVPECGERSWRGHVSLLSSQLAGCVTHTQPVELFQLTAESPRNKAMQTRFFETKDEVELLSASAAVLQDLGFQVEESVQDVGFLRATKERSAREYGQDIGRLFTFLLSLGKFIMPVDLHQKIAATLIARPINLEATRQEVRIIFYRVVWKGDGQADRQYIPPGQQKMEMLRDPVMYQQFFAKLSKAVFLEALYALIKKTMRHAMRAISGIILIAGALLLQGCAAPEPSQDLLALTEAQMKIRSIQTRTFDVKDRQLAMRGVIAALQDLGFIIERANEPLGLVTAARFAEPNYNDVVGVTVTVRQEDGKPHDDPSQCHLQQQADRRPQGVSELLCRPRTVALHHQGVRHVELSRAGQWERSRLDHTGTRHRRHVSHRAMPCCCRAAPRLTNGAIKTSGTRGNRSGSRKRAKSSCALLNRAYSRPQTDDGRSRSSSQPCRTSGSWSKSWMRSLASSRARGSNHSNGPVSARIPTTTSTMIKAS